MPAHIQLSEAPRHPGEYPPAGALLRERFVIVRTLAATRQSTVYLGYDRRSARLVAIKRLSTAALAGDQAQTAAHAFRQEARLLGELRHPQLPRLHDAFGGARGHYLVMDYIEGLTLDRLLGRVAIDLTTALAIADGLCEIVGYLHRQAPPIIHADIKPSNIMLTTAGRVMLIDLGLAHRVGQLSASYGPMGTPPYAPPEQWHAAPLDQRSDIYALGIVLRDLLGSAAGRPVCAEVFARATAPARTDRFASVAELRRALLGPALPALRPRRPVCWAWRDQAPAVCNSSSHF